MDCQICGRDATHGHRWFRAETIPGTVSIGWGESIRLKRRELSGWTCCRCTKHVRKLIR